MLYGLVPVCRSAQGPGIFKITEFEFVFILSDEIIYLSVAAVIGDDDLIVFEGLDSINS